MSDPGRGRDASARALRATSLYKRVLTLANAVSQEGHAVLGVLSVGERCTMALVFNLAAWLPEDYTIIDAVHRVGDEWFRVATLVHRDGWNEHTERWDPDYAIQAGRISC